MIQHADRRGNVGAETGFPLRFCQKTKRTQNLKVPGDSAMTVTVDERAAVNRHLTGKLPDAICQYRLLKFRSEIHIRVYKKRCQIILDRTLAACLKVDGKKTSVFHHDIPGLKIPVHEACHGALQRVVRQTVEFR